MVQDATPAGARSFPAGFWWGAATAAHQIEGGNVGSDWWEREHAPWPTVAEPSGDACDSYHRYPEDMKLAADAGLTMYRFSVEWARVEPERGSFSRAQIEHYRRMVGTACGRGLEPMVTLHHFTTPRWFAHAGGWKATDAADRFARYVEALEPVLDGVTWICTVNEPNILAATTATQPFDPTPPAGGLPQPDQAIGDGLLAAHRRAREILRGSHRRVGWTVATQAYQAEPGCEDVAARYGYPRDVWYLEAAADDDFVGVQAYTRTRIGPDGPLPIPAGTERTLTGWEYYPGALAEGVRLAATHAPGVPVFVTENGLATDDDDRRIAYTQAALEGLHEVMASGVRVEGYLHWSLLDNYEWGSFRPTFGLVSVDRDTFVRTPKPSLAWLGAIATSNALPTSDAR